MRMFITDNLMRSNMNTKENNNEEVSQFTSATTLYSN